MNGKKLRSLLFFSCLLWLITVVPITQGIDYEYVTFSDEFTGANYQPANPDKWNYLQDEPESNISLLNNRLYSCGGFFDGDTDILESEEVFPNLLLITFNYSREIILGMGGSFSTTKFQIRFNSTYYISIHEYGMVSGGQITSDTLSVAIVNDTQTIYVTVLAFYWYPNCLQNAILYMEFSQFQSNCFTFNFYYFNGTYALDPPIPVMYQLISVTYLVGNLSAFNTTVHFKTSPLSVTSAGGATSYDNLEINYKIEKQPETLSHLLLIIIIGVSIGGGIVALVLYILWKKEII